MRPHLLARNDLARRGEKQREGPRGLWLDPDVAALAAQLANLPQGRAPTLSDWQAISRRMRFEIDQRINLLTRTRNQLDQCIGCGCLSLQKCQLYNKDDRMGAKGAGPRAILG